MIRIALVILVAGYWFVAGCGTVNHLRSQGAEYAVAHMRPRNSVDEALVMAAMPEAAFASMRAKRDDHYGER